MTDDHSEDSEHSDKMAAVTAGEAANLGRDALSRVAELEGTVAHQRERIERLEELVSELQTRVKEATDRDYPELSRAEKVGILRSEAYATATAKNGRSYYDYDDVWKLFDREPSESHCYNLMQWAAEGWGDRDHGVEGMEYQERPHGHNNRLVVHAEQVRVSQIDFAAKNRVEGGDHA